MEIIVSEPFKTSLEQSESPKQRDKRCNKFELDIVRMEFDSLPSN